MLGNYDSVTLVLTAQHFCTFQLCSAQLYIERNVLTADFPRFAFSPLPSSRFFFAYSALESPRQNKLV